jgi:hypothetical protein
LKFENRIQRLEEEKDILTAKLDDYHRMKVTNERTRCEALFRSYGLVYLRVLTVNFWLIF